MYKNRQRPHCCDGKKRYNKEPTSSQLFVSFVNKETFSYFIGCGCSKVVILASGLRGHLSCHSRDMEQQISKQLHRAEPVETNEEMERTARQNKSDIYSVTDVLRRFLKPT